MVAKEGFVEVAPNGDRIAVLLNGRRYEGSPGTAEYRVMNFERYEIRIESKEAQLDKVSIKGISTLELIQNPDSTNLGELVWRMGLPLVALVLALLAIPLSFVNPRASTSLNLMFAVFAYMVYSNLLSIVQAWVTQGRISFHIGWWIVHALMLLVFALMTYRRISLRLLPRLGK